MGYLPLIYLPEIPSLVPSILVSEPKWHIEMQPLLTRADQICNEDWTLFRFRSDNHIGCRNIRKVLPPKDHPRQ
jgi:hypothetical protein